MIDWLRLRLPRVAEWDLPAGHLLRIDEDGNQIQDIILGTQIPSFDTSIRVRPIDAEIEVSGNPSKFLQGHNLFGSSDLKSTVKRFLYRIERLLGFKIFPNHSQKYCSIHEIHVSQLVDMDSEQNMRNFLLQLGRLGSTRHKRYSSYEGETVYLGKTKGKGCRASDLYYWRFYDKKKELLSHKKSRILNHWNIGSHLRAELVLKRKHLYILGLTTVQNWTEEKMDQIFLDHLDRIKVATCNVVGEQALPPVGMRSKDMPLWYLWFSGNDLRTHYTKTTFYRLRANFLLLYGIDLGKPPYISGENILDFGWHRLRSKNHWMQPYNRQQWRKVG